MDAHYDQVMKARAQMSAEPKLYFAYTTALDSEAFEQWRDQHGYSEFTLPEGTLAKADGHAIAFNFPSRFWGGRVAGLVAAPQKHVWGKVFQIAGTDWPIIQHKEGMVTGMSVEHALTVAIEGRTVEATAFATNPLRVSTDGPVSSTFIEAWIRGVRSAGLPNEWLEEIMSASHH